MPNTTTAKKIPAPFSSPSWAKRDCESAEGCALCGRETQDKPGRLEVWVVEGGARFAALDETNVTGDMGLFYIGSECAKRLPATHKREA